MQLYHRPRTAASAAASASTSASRPVIGCPNPQAADLTTAADDQAAIKLNDCPILALQQTLQQQADTSIEPSNKSGQAAAAASPPPAPPRTIKHASPGPISEFVQKLYRMLEESQHEDDTLCWGVDGASFIVNDVDEFSRTVLPRHFKHGNFASFVRQLNKYGFHKVRHSDVHGRRIKQSRDQVCEFAHPSFRRDRKDLLGTIRRKTCSERAKRGLLYAGNALGTRQSQRRHQHPDVAVVVTDADADDGDGDKGCKKDVESLRGMVESLQGRLDGLQQSHDQMQQSLAQHNERGVIVLKEFLELERTMAAKDVLIRQILKLVAGDTDDQAGSHSDGLVSIMTTHTLANAYTRVAQSGRDQMQSITRHLQQASSSSPSSSSALNVVGKTSPIGSPLSEPYSDPRNHLNALSPSALRPDCVEMGTPPRSPETTTTSGSACVTPPPGFVSPAPTTITTTCIDEDLDHPMVSASDLATPSTPPSGNVEWTVPPHVLLVDDDRVCRDLSGKLLQLVGCTIDLARDGVEALHKLTMKKYDLVLMDIMMPNLDGISATRNIRQYDSTTPIVSMTSNFSDKDIMMYVGSGMTDILPKPFNANTLYTILEKYCAHLKTAMHTPAGKTTKPTALELNTALSLLASMAYHPDTTSTIPSESRTDDDSTAALHVENFINVMDTS